MIEFQFEGQVYHSGIGSYRLKIFENFHNKTKMKIFLHLFCYSQVDYQEPRHLYIYIYGMVTKTFSTKKHFRLVSCLN